MSKSKNGKPKKKKVNEFAVMHPNAAGIDVSSKDHVVAVPSDRDKEPIRTFGCYTCDLKSIALSRTIIGRRTCCRLAASLL